MRKADRRSTREKSPATSTQAQGELSRRITTATVSRFCLRQAATAIAAAGLVAYPTEGVYGIGCDPADAAAVARLLALKRRPAAKGLILIAASFEQLSPWIEPIDAKQRSLVDEGWPGPVTWLVPARSRTPRYLRGRHRSIAVRVTAHPVAAALCRAAGRALVSTSANLASRPPARTAAAVRQHFRGRLQPPDYVLAGAVGGQSGPTEIRDLVSGRIVRRGA